MDAAVKDSRKTSLKHALKVAAFAPTLPQILGSAFNIWYNTVVVRPLLGTDALRERFADTILFYNLLVFPLAIAAWTYAILRLRPVFRSVLAGEEVPPYRLNEARGRVINLPWVYASLAAAAWLLCIPVFLGALALVPGPLDPRVFMHLPISFVVSAFIAVTQGIFLVEIASHWGLFPVLFEGSRPDRMKIGYSMTIRARGLMWAISAGVCPIGSLLLLSAAPTVSEEHFEIFVGLVGIAFGLCSALLIGQLVATPVDQLRHGAQAVADGNLDVSIPLQRADEFGALIGEFNAMVAELREKERLRQTFGLHVGRRAAEQILARDPGLGGTEQFLTAMFVDIRGFTRRSANAPPAEIVRQLNEFLGVMVAVVENEHHGMVNKYLGDGFMALFGIGDPEGDHAGDAVRAAAEMLRKLETLNAHRGARAEEAMRIGVGIHTGEAVVGSVGSPERLEYTAIGATLNLASRIEGLTKTADTPVLCSEATRAAMKSPVNLRALPPLPVKGIDQPIAIYALG